MSKIIIIKFGELMASFQDNFKRDSEEDMLEYDDSAFYYFSMSILTVLVFPYTIYLLKNLIRGDLGLI